MYAQATIAQISHSANAKVIMGNNKDMAVTVEMQNTGDPRTRTEVVAMIEHVLSGRPGEWRVSVIGSRENDNWEMKIEGPTGFQRSYTLAGAAGEHQPNAIRLLLLKLLPVSSI
jgi:hypothetical protein